MTFDFPANTTVLAEIGELVADASRNAGFNDVETADIQLALDEACTNTIIHGLKKDENQTFQLVIHWKMGRIEILIHETGEPFDPTHLKPPKLRNSLENHPVGGFGVYFIRKLMDEVEYDTDKDGMKTLRMVKIKPAAR